MRRMGGAVRSKRVTSTANAGGASSSTTTPDRNGPIATTGALAEEASVARGCGTAAQQSGSTERSTGPSSRQQAWALSARSAQGQSKAAIPAKATSAATTGRAPNLINPNGSMRGRLASSPTLPGCAPGVPAATGRWGRAAPTIYDVRGRITFRQHATAVQAVREAGADPFGMEPRGTRDQTSGNT